MRLSLRQNLGNTDRTMRVLVGVATSAMAIVQYGRWPDPAVIFLGFLGISFLLEAATGY